MNSEDFVSRIKEVIHDDVVSNLIHYLENPTGRKPHKSIIHLKEYLANLSENEKVMLQKVIAHATHSSIFGFLTVLDGVRVIENPSERGELKLYWEQGDEKVLLNNSEGQYLHDIYQAEVYSEIFEDET